MSSQANDMLQYVRSLDKSAWEQAKDVLQGGINRSLNLRDAQSDRLTLSLALTEIFALERDWEGAVEASNTFISFHNDSGQSLLQPQNYPHWAAATQLRCMALLAQGQDDQFGNLRRTLASETTNVVGSAMKLDMHALGSLSRTFTRGQAWGGTSQRDSLETLPQLQRAAALTHFALADIAMGDTKEAGAWLGAAEDALDIKAPIVGDVLLFRELWHTRTSAEIALARAQVAMAEKRWEHAEDDLSRAVQLTEEAFGAGDRMTAVPLALTAHVYSRTGRVVFAEGLLRESAKLLHLSAEDDRSSPWRGPTHPTCSALVAWQLGQLYGAMPQRGGEAERWAALARNLWTYPEDIAEHLGTKDALTGKGSRGKMYAVSWMCERVFAGTSERS